MSDPDKKKRRCSRCNKEFSTRQGCQMHIDMKHKGKGERVAIKPRDDEPSIAELMIDAQIARACGEPVEDWLADML